MKRFGVLLSAVLVAIGLWVRLRIGETPAFREALERAPPPTVPLGTLLRHHWAPTLAASAGVVSAFAIFYLSTAFALSHMTVERGVSRETVLALQLAANVFLALGIVLAAIGSDRIGTRWMLACGAAATVALGLVFGNATTLATEEAAQAAGTGSAVMGALQFGLGALVSPLVGLRGEHDALPMAVTMVVLALGAAVAARVAATAPRDVPDAPMTELARG